jgi:hypothetical protein
VDLTRTHPWRTFLGAALAINALCFALVRLVPRPQVEFGAALDVAITVPALYLLLIVRAGLAPAISAAPLFLLGLLRATWLVPGFAIARPLLSAVAEIAIGTLLLVRVRRGLRAPHHGDLLELMESAAREIVPSRRVAAVLAGELAVFWYAFASWRRAPDVPRGARAFTLHRQSGVATLFGFLAGVSLIEAALVHLLVAQWSVTAAWVLTCLSVYGALWLAAVARSFVLRPLLVTADEIVLRAGLLWTVRIPFSSITTERPGALCDLRVPILADPNVVLRLAEPAIARGVYGISRKVTTVEIGLDDPSAFIRLF